MNILILLTYLISIVLKGIGDGLNQTNKKDWGHIFVAGSTAVLLSTPFWLVFIIPKWYIYILMYCFFRFAIFDVVWNITAGQKWNYIGITPFMDKFFRKYPSWMKTFVQIISLVLAISLTLRYL